LVLSWKTRLDTICIEIWLSQNNGMGVGAENPIS
jgi:hypothetical protein